MSVQGSSRQSKAEIQADKNRLLQICLGILEIFWYLRYPGDWPRDAESLGRSLCLWGAVLGNIKVLCSKKMYKFNTNTHTSVAIINFDIMRILKQCPCDVQ
jgi:hypothetical protein